MANPPSKLAPHGFHLRCKTTAGLSLSLRPMTEADWPLVLRWNSDSEVLYYSEGDDVTHRDLSDVQDIYRQTSLNGILFVIESASGPIGECWLQKMNLPEYSDECRGRDCRRIDIAIGEKRLWGTGVGTAVVGELTRFGFAEQGADAIYCCGVADYNERSRRVAMRNGYHLVARHSQPVGSKMRYTEDYALSRDEWLGS